jgi:hypothetical protein
MHRKGFVRLIAPVLLLAAVTAPTAPFAGEMEPPGPPGPTMKPVFELEPRHPIWPEMLPFTIGEPGSYYLAAPAIDVPGGITVTVARVTIDLNGFVLKGNPTSGVGIDATGVGEVAVVGGTVRGFPGGGVLLGTWSDVRNVRVIATGGIGIQVGSGSLVLDSGASGNSGDGIVAASNTLVQNCVVSDNRGRGIVVSGGIVRGCTSEVNDSHGIDVSTGCLVIGNTAIANGEAVPATAAGIRVTGQANRIEGNHLAFNDIGLQVTGTGNIVLRNTSRYAGQTTPYSIAPGNRRGPIVDASLVDDLSTVTHGDHPWANFIF